MTSASRLTDRLKSLGHELGFAQIGVAPAVTPTGFHRLLQWIESGYSADMHWVDRRKDAYRHPDGVMPGTRSVIMAAMNYHDGTSPTTGARVARYAAGSADYHDIMKRQLQHIAELVHSEIPATRTRVVVDTAPLLERDFGRLSGIGWFGKNTMLISRTIGSWFFLGAVLTDAELEYDTPFDHDFCGTCTRCLDACPTDAFPEPGVLDSRRCISYLTIEHRRDPIPEELRKGIGDWLFGCDICQEVCPWNRFASEETLPEFHHHAGTSPADCRELLRLDEEQFQTRFGNTPLARPGRAGLLRNAAIVLGNLRAIEAEPELVASLNDPEPLIRGAAAWALGILATPSSLAALKERSAIESHPLVRIELSDTLEAHKTR